MGFNHPAMSTCSGNARLRKGAIVPRRGKNMTVPCLAALAATGARDRWHLMSPRATGLYRIWTGGLQFGISNPSVLEPWTFRRPAHRRLRHTCRPFGSRTVRGEHRSRCAIREASGSGSPKGFVGLRTTTLVFWSMSEHVNRLPDMSNREVVLRRGEKMGCLVPYRSTRALDRQNLARNDQFDAVYAICHALVHSPVCVPECPGEFGFRMQSHPQFIRNEDDPPFAI